MKFWQFIKLGLGEVLVLLLFLTMVNNYIGNVDTTINADGIGYYDYLPAAFIHHDLVRFTDDSLEDLQKLERVKSNNGVYVPAQSGYWVNKYACGTALLQLPFFAYVYYDFYIANAAQHHDENAAQHHDENAAQSNNKNLQPSNNLNAPPNNQKNGASLKPDFKEGYQLPFQKGVFYAALFYLVLALFFFKLLLQLYQIDAWIIWFTQAMLALATGLTHYANFDAGFSHLYSLFAITAFLYFIRAYFLSLASKSFIWACVFFGLILLLRPVNVLVIALLPFMAGSAKQLKSALLHLFKNIPILILGLLIVIGFVGIMSLVWYVQCGQIFLNTYQHEEGFYFFNPQFVNILFSYRKGLFIYTPILLLTLWAWIYLLYQKRYYETLTSFGFFVLLTYVLSAWWSWFYGCSYGLRAYIEFYPLFFIPIAILVQTVKKWMKVLVIVFALACTYLNLVQTYQYKEYILHWVEMDAPMYWKVFGKTTRKYKGILWKRQYDYNDYDLRKTIELNASNGLNQMATDTAKINSDSIPHFKDVVLMKIDLHSNFLESSETRIHLQLRNNLTGKLYYEFSVPLIHFVDADYGKEQQGYSAYEIPLAESVSSTIEMCLEQNSMPGEIDHVYISFFSKK